MSNPAMPPSNTPRLTFIDAARTFAIFLALLAHVFSSTGFFHKLGSDAILIKQFTRMATPLFVFMFGFMIEYVYVRRVERLGIDGVTKRVFMRSFQCYIAYALTSLSAVAGGYQSMDMFFNSLLFFSNSRFGNILRAYSIMLLLAPMIIKLRLKFGVKSILLFLIAITVSYSFIDYFQLMDFGIFNHQFNIVIGVGLHKGGPSVYGAMSFLLAGMFLASSLSSTDITHTTRFSNFYFNSFVLIIVFYILGYFLIQDNAVEAWRLFSDFTYRKNNSPAYYIIGIIGSVLIINTLYILVGKRPLPAPIKYILPLGTSSLISFTTGNIILNFFSGLAKNVNILIFIVLFFLLTLLITKHISKMPFYTSISNVLNFKYQNIGLGKL